MGLATLRHVGSSWIRDGTRVSCTGRRILYHWVTREALWLIFYLCWSYFFRLITVVCSCILFFFLAEDWVQSLGWENPLEKEMANHSSVLAWKVPWTEEPGGLQSLWSHRVGHNWATNYWNLFFVSTWRPIGGYSLPFSQSSIKRTQRGSEIHTLVLEFIQGILHFLSLSLFFW